jgi:hypothetical protein
MAKHVTAMNEGETPKMIAPTQVEHQKCGICGFKVTAQSSEAVRANMVDHRLYALQEGLHGSWRN